MSIGLECPGCKTPFAVDDSLAGRRATCKVCGSKIVIPGVGQSSLGSNIAGPRAISVAISLAEATPKQIVAELARRKVSAVLAYSDPDNAAQATAGDLLDSDASARRTLSCLKTNDLTDDHVCSLLSRLAEQAKREQAVRVASDGVTNTSEMFELKGDWLGMTLEEFKHKHRRELPQLGRIMPWCSDETPGRDIPDLMAEAWHSNAGIVNCRLDLPAENNSMSIAQEKTESVIYQFIDGKLFQIEARFPTPAFHRVLEALNKKFGKPVSESQSPRSIEWWSMSATIELRFGSIRPARPAVLRFYHDALFQLALKRVPSHTQDI